jgi:hypothetical protein
VEEMTVTSGGQPRRIEVPVEIPEGVSYEGVFGREKGEARLMPAMAAQVVSGGGGSLPRALLVREADAARPEPQRAVRIDPALKGKTGKLEVRVWLTDTSNTTLAELKKLGFEIVFQPKGTKLVVGRIAAEKLTALAELKAVRYVAPM